MLVAACSRYRAIRVVEQREDLGHRHLLAVELWLKSGHDLFEEPRPGIVAGDFFLDEDLLLGFAELVRPLEALNFQAIAE